MKAKTKTADPPRSVGRPTELTPEVAQAVCANISMGLTFIDACRMAHVARRSFERWRERGETETDGIYHDLVEMVEEAEAGFKYEHLSRIVAHSKKKAAGKWVCSAWLLERKYPQEFAMRSHLAVTSKLAEFVKAFDEIKNDPAVPEAT